MRSYLPSLRRAPASFAMVPPDDRRPVSPQRGEGSNCTAITTKPGRAGLRVAPGGAPARRLRPCFDGLAQLLHRAGLDLAHALGGDAVLVGELLQAFLFVPEPAA